MSEVHEKGTPEPDNYSDGAEQSRCTESYTRVLRDPGNGAVGATTKMHDASSEEPGSMAIESLSIADTALPVHVMRNCSEANTPISVPKPVSAALPPKVPIRLSIPGGELAEALLMDSRYTRALFNKDCGTTRCNLQGYRKVSLPQALSPKLAHQRSTGMFKDANGVPKRRTFTARPAPGVSRHPSRIDYTHNEARLVDIARETRSLVSRLERVYGRDVGTAISAKSPPRGKPCNESHTQRNRRAFVEKIATENLQMYNRLQAVKPSKDTAAAHLQKQWKMAQKYSLNCSVSRVRCGKPRGIHLQARQPKTCEHEHGHKTEEFLDTSEPTFRVPSTMENL